MAWIGQHQTEAHSIALLAMAVCRACEEQCVIPNGAAVLHELEGCIIPPLRAVGSAAPCVAVLTSMLNNGVGEPGPLRFTGSAGSIPNRQIMLLTCHSAVAVLSSTALAGPLGSLIRGGAGLAAGFWPTMREDARFVSMQMFLTGQVTGAEGIANQAQRMPSNSIVSLLTHSFFMRVRWPLRVPFIKIRSDQL